MSVDGPCSCVVLKLRGGVDYGSGHDAHLVDRSLYETGGYEGVEDCVYARNGKSGAAANSV